MEITPTWDPGVNLQSEVRLHSTFPVTLIMSEKRGIFSDMPPTKDPSPASSIDSRIRKQIRESGAGSVFTPSNFLKLGSRAAVDKALSRLTAKGVVRRVARGLYDFPKTHPRLGVLSPSVEAVAKALAGRHGIRLQPSGAYAANLLRLSEQVPAKVVFLTDGPSRKVKIGNQEITLKQAAPRQLGAAGRTSGMVIEALRYLGKENITPERIGHLRKLLSSMDKAVLLDDLELAPAWMHEHIRYISGEKKA